jgi:enamine deaminase RidA (YjgF/YER057c/UK114 family)
VRLNTYLTDPADVGAFRGIRDEIMDGVLTASTLVIVAGLVHPDMKVEIECVAAKA